MTAVTTLTVRQVTDLIDSHFPQVHAGGKILFVEDIGLRTARVRMTYDSQSVRPGGTISGPAMFKLADFSFYVALLGLQGAAALQAVTTNINLNFLSRPAQRDMVAQVRLLKVGRRLAVGEVALYSVGSPDMVAHATATYAMPPEHMKRTTP